MSLTERLRELIRERCFLRSDEPVFRLSSGQMSKVYFDLRRATLSPEGQYLVGHVVLERLQALGLRPKAVGGLTLGADPIATAAAFASYLKGTPLEAFVVRKEPKRYGTMRQIEGCVEAPDPVVILEDVLTTGGSARKAVEAARREGLKVLAVLVLLDRQEGGAEAIKALGLPLYSIFTAEEFF